MLFDFKCTCYVMINKMNCLNIVAFNSVIELMNNLSTAPVYNPPKAGVLQIGIRAVTIGYDIRRNGLSYSYL